MVGSGRQRTGGFAKDRVAYGAQTGAVVGARFSVERGVASVLGHE